MALPHSASAVEEIAANVTARQCARPDGEAGVACANNELIVTLGYIRLEFGRI